MQEQSCQHVTNQMCSCNMENVSFGQNMCSFYYAKFVVKCAGYRWLIIHKRYKISPLQYFV